MKRFFLTCLTAFLFALYVASFHSCSNRGRVNPPIIEEIDGEDSINHPITYNFYIENSGSMMGYFSGNGTSDLETLISEYHDRLTENDFEGDTVTLNYINTSIVPSSDDLSKYLKSAKSKCTESYTKIDDILKMTMGNVDKNKVNIVISDYSFESDFGTLKTAQSHITKLFTQQLNSNKTLSVAIIKYMANFSGNYYPGKIPCKKAMPIYFWIFGNAQQVKRMSELPIKSNNCGVVLLQMEQILDAKIKVKNARAIDNGNQIIVDQWKSERNTRQYSADVIVDLSNTIVHDNDLINKNLYKIESTSSSIYYIDSIIKDGERYTFRIQTDKPSPCNLSISYPLFLPQWVENYSFEGKGLPPDSATYGIKYLIGGVFDAYNQKSKDYFVFNITLK